MATPRGHLSFLTAVGSEYPIGASLATGADVALITSTGSIVYSDSPLASGVLTASNGLPYAPALARPLVFNGDLSRLRIRDCGAAAAVTLVFYSGNDLRL